MQEVAQTIAVVCAELFNVQIEPAITRPDEQFGDYATNVALQLGKQVGQNPREVAQAIVEKLRHPNIQRAEVAGPGFINLTLTDKALVEVLNAAPTQKYINQKVLVEFGDPNPLKAMHLGHLYTTIVGDAISRLFEAAGATVKRLSYHGDVGMHVAKAIYGIGQAINWQTERLKEFEQPEFQIGEMKLTLKTVIGYLYAEGARAFEANETAQAKIREINKKVYSREDNTINTIYDWGVERSFAYFDLIFEELGVRYDQRYLESQAAPVGTETVKQQLGTVFEESDGAIVYKGERKGLHTRVFINSEGLPTYEAKDLGLAQLKDRDYPATNLSIIITANEQAEYFKVMLAALSEFNAPLAQKTRHIAHGFLSLSTGKMSSRTGNVYGAQDLLTSTELSVSEQYPDSAVQREVYLAAVKYTFLRNRIGGDITFDVQESVVLEGNSGPYIQYAHARARSILSKALPSPESPAENLQFEAGERSLLRKISEFSEVVDKAVSELMPHHICTYLYELAQTFNSFYEHNRVIDDPRQTVRLWLVGAYADTLKRGLELLNIPAPDRM